MERFNSATASRWRQARPAAGLESSSPTASLPLSLQPLTQHPGVERQRWQDDRRSEHEATPSSRRSCPQEHSSRWPQAGQAVRREDVSASPRTMSSEQWRAMPSVYSYGQIRAESSMRNEHDSNNTAQRPLWQVEAVTQAIVKGETSPGTRTMQTVGPSISLPSFAAFHEAIHHRSDASQSRPYTIETYSSDPECSHCSSILPLIPQAASAAHQLMLAFSLHNDADDQMASDLTGQRPEQVLGRLIKQLSMIKSYLHRLEDHKTGSRTDSVVSSKRSTDDYEQSSTCKRAKFNPAGQDYSAPPLRPSTCMPSPRPTTRQANGPATPRESGFTTLAEAHRTVHGSPCTSTTTQHIASLEQQLLCQTQSLQLLESEHKNLLQKWQREQPKLQTLERKCQQGDSEINELTAKHEEMCEQVRALEEQLVLLERRRADEADSANREKDQWLRMLDMNGQLQQRVHAECQQLREENCRLKDARQRCEGDGDVSTGGLQPAYGRHYKTDHPPHPAMWSPTHTTALQKQVAAYRTAFKVAKGQTEELKAQLATAEQQREAISSVIERALTSPGIEDS